MTGEGSDVTVLRRDRIDAVTAGRRRTTSRKDTRPATARSTGDGHDGVVVDGRQRRTGEAR